MKHAFGLIAALMISTAAHAHGVTKGDIEIIHPNIPQPAAGAKAAGGYMGISNEGTEADRLIAVETEAAGKAELHISEIGDDGVATMRHLPEGIEIPAGDTVVLERGGLHVMLMGLTGPLTEGDMVKATLVFEHAGKVEMEFMVDPPGGEDHSKMDHSDHSTAE
ncbi:copper chaperone PCu(A)C [Rhodobacter sp. SGA-6-6]|uniref:copper chaperone PCu(A)C n=1 Tax=Rhodobacter sp. SGA-6-6 TaxID=2710882 RepID=UPI0013ED52CE|nr:copper chaperone PCu(A)C [Rhodobacter sp. SGA-6-6]NGM44459.1 copper chaperone PCu(A)C [Rhodobacter sp. SGA-6-6]